MLCNAVQFENASLSMLFMLSGIIILFKPVQLLKVPFPVLSILPEKTTLVNFEAKWKNLVDPQTPVPTPVEDKYKNKIGVFEGGGYVAKGVYRPTYNSLMNSFSSNEFNQVCKNVLQKIINFYSE